MEFIALALSFVAIGISIYIAHRQNKIALFKERFEVYKNFIILQDTKLKMKKIYDDSNGDLDKNIDKNKEIVELFLLSFDKDNKSDYESEIFYHDLQLKFNEINMKCDLLFKFDIKDKIKEESISFVEVIRALLIKNYDSCCKIEKATDNYTWFNGENVYDELLEKMEKELKL